MAVVAGMTAAQMFTAAMAVTSIALSITTMMQGRPSFQQGDMGANINRKGTDNPNIVTFGNTVIPAVQVWNKVSPRDSKYLVEVHSLGHGPLKAIKNVYIDEQALFGKIGNDIAEQWLAATQSGFNNVHVGLRRGNFSNTPFQAMIDHSGGEWTSECRGDGIANLNFMIERPSPSTGDVSVRVLSDKFAATALVEGIPVIDPRVDTMLLGWSDARQRKWVNNGVESYRNPACALLTYLADSEFGFRLDPDMVDLKSFITLANWCDSNKITLDGYIDQNSTFGDIVNNFASSWGGSVYLVGGKISVSAETSSPVRFNIKEDDLVDTVSLTNNKSDYFNTIKIDFQNKSTDFAKDSFVLPKDSLKDETIREDGRIIEKTLDCPLSTDPEYIKYIANRELKRSKLCRKEINISVSNIEFPLEMGDIFTVTETMYNLDQSTKWRVIKLDNTLDDKTLITKVTAQEYDARIYDRSDYNDGNLSSLKPVEDYTVLPVTSLKFSQNTGHNIGSGTLSWNTNYYSDARYVVQYRLTGETEWQTYGQYPSTSVIMTNLQTGRNYDFRVRVVASVGGSSWTTITNQKVNKSISLPKVSNLACDFTSPDAIITFGEINAPVTNNSVVGDGITNLSQLVAYYQVTINGKSYRSSNGRYAYSYITNAQNGLTRNLDISVRAVSIYGDQGEISTIKARNEPMGQPAAVKVESELVNLTVSWLNPSDTVSDYQTTDIWITETKLSPKPENLVSDSSVGWWTSVRANKGITKGWIWIAHRDVFGYDGVPIYSTPIYFEETSIDDLLTDSPSFQEVEDNLEDVKNELAKQGGEIVELNDTVGLQETAISNNKTLIETTNSKLAQTTSTVQAQGVTITEQTQALSQLDGTVQALKTIKLDVNGKVSGLQMGNDGTTSTFDVLADVFRVSHGTSSQAVFEIRDSKTYIKNAMIGDLTASQIRAGSITGNEINSNSIIRAGSGNTSVTMDGSNATWRLYAGNTNPAAAPFRVNTAGKLFATDCEIVGKITGTSGSFSGNIDAQSGQISGCLGVGNSYISGNPQHNFIQGADGRFVVDRAGNMTCNYARITGGEFGGIVRVENLQGDVYRKGFYSNKVIPTVIISGGSGEREFFRADVSYQPFNQQVVLSYVDVPVRMYDNPGKCEVYYQIQGQSPVWLQNIDGPNGSKATPILNFSVVIPAGSTWVRFFIVPFNKITYERAQAIAGVIEMMKSEQIGWSVTTT